MDVELDIVNRRGVLTRNTIEVGAGTTLTEIKEAAMQLMGICQWQRVRVGVGDMWSRWISAAEAGGERKEAGTAENGGAPVGTGAAENGGAHRKEAAR